MQRCDRERLWARVQWLLRQPPAADDAELRRAARMLASSRSDAVELLLARWLAEGASAPGIAAGAVGGATGVADADGPAAGGVSGAPPAARRAAGFGLREAALLGAGLAGGALAAGALCDEDGLDWG
ncbi:MAG: hypothetical protein ACK5Y0_13005 [Pseudomonadota bacterium]|jgi:hypothetical protein